MNEVTKHKWWTSDIKKYKVDAVKQRIKKVNSHVKIKNFKKKIDDFNIKKIIQSLFYLLIQILDLYWWIVIINVIISWLIGFNVLNTQNRFVFAVLNATHQLTDPVLNKIRRFIPNLGSIDISPVVLILLLIFIRNLFFELVAPNLF